MYTLHNGDCREVMASMEPESVHSIVTDPPYGLNFMGKGWDHGIPAAEFWAEALRVAKPGAHMLAFGGTRTFHRLMCAIEDAGWEIRDTIMWVYGSGFPKSMDVGRAIDKAARGVPQGGPDPTSPNAGKFKTQRTEGKRSETDRGQHFGAGPGQFMREQAIANLRTELVPEAEQWSGWGTALKPAWEPIIIARKPLIGTVAKNVLAHGTGAMNIDETRVEYASQADINQARVPQPKFDSDNPGVSLNFKAGEGRNGEMFDPNNKGRWPANLIHDGSDEVIEKFPETTSGKLSPHHATGKNPWTDSSRPPFEGEWGGDSGSAARFFYCAKTSKADRGDGNNHPTVKPTALMQYLCRLITPPNGIILDPFMGSGSTGKAAVREGFSFVGIDLDAEYCKIAGQRIEAAVPIENKMRIS